MKIFYLLTILSFIGARASLFELDSSSDLPELTVFGTHYEIGYAIGKTFSSRINGFVNSNQNLATVLIPFYNSVLGKQIFNEFLLLNKAAYPQYFDEMQGTADATGIPSWKLLLLNLEDEIGSIAGTVKLEACTDIHVDNFLIQSYIHGHNEDAETTVKQFAYVVHAHIVDPKYNTNVNITCYSYPGFLFGVAYGFNDYGMTFTQNAVFPANPRVGLSDGFIGRDVYNARDINDALRIIGVNNRAHGFSYNIGSVHEKTIWNIEMAPTAFGALEVWEIEDQVYYHVNMYRHVNVPQLADNSSIHRAQRIIELWPPANGADIRMILGDTKDPVYPIYRDGVPPDCCVTCSTVLFDLEQGTMSIYTANPKTSQPVWVYSIPK